jgi:hypothetical protein
MSKIDRSVLDSELVLWLGSMSDSELARWCKGLDLIQNNIVYCNIHHNQRIASCKFVDLWQWISKHLPQHEDKLNFG